MGLTALGMVPGPIGMIATVANIGRGIAGMIGAPETNALGQTQSYGYGNQSIDAFDNTVGGLDNTVSEMNMDNQGLDAADSIDGPPSDAQEGMGAVGDGGAGAAAAAASSSADDADSEDSGWADGGMIDFYAQGGIASLAYGGNPPPTGYANQAFEGMVPGVGTGMSDNVPFSIEGDQPALLSRDEYVLPADVVSQLGDGSSGAGSDMLDNFISQVRQTKYGNTQQPPPVGPQLMTGLMRNGGIV
mgnify:FL=1